MPTTTPTTADPTLAHEAGFTVPVIFTPAAWDSAVTWTDADADETGALQDEAGRLWDVLTMAARAVRGAPPGLVCEDFTVIRVPRGMPYRGDEDEPDLEWAVAMYLPMVVIVGGTPTVATIGLEEE